jgi:hypothetical protein
LSITEETHVETLLQVGDTELAEIEAAGPPPMRTRGRPLKLAMTGVVVLPVAAVAVAWGLLFTPDSPPELRLPPSRAGLRSPCRPVPGRWARDPSPATGCERSCCGTTSDIELPSHLTVGGRAPVHVVGDLTVHGVSRAVSIPVQAQCVGGRIEVVGSLSFPWDYFDMVRPDLSYVTVEADPTLEFEVFFDHR